MISYQSKKSLPRDELRQSTNASLWRKPKALAEKENEVVGIRLTISEMDKLKKKAGMIPLATFVKHHLREETDLLR